jgi:phosphocarrier protein
MFSATVTVPNKTGLHARPASQLVMLSQKFESKLRIVSGDAEVDPTSIISILAAGIKQGTTVELTAEGPDEEAAGRDILNFIKGLTE